MKSTDGVTALPAPDLAKSTEGGTEEGFAQDLFDKQKAHLPRA
jgi:hypothetical protein